MDGYTEYLLNTKETRLFFVLLFISKSEAEKADETNDLKNGERGHEKTITEH